MAKQKTWTPKLAEIGAGEWYLVDATGIPLGRLASNVAKLLRGKHKPTFTRHLNVGDHVVVVNAERILATGSKVEDKAYLRYSGYPGGLRSRSLRRQMAVDSTFPITNAVRGMLPNNTLGAEQLRRLRVYSGAAHEHAAQSPKAITFNQKGDLELG